MGAEIFNKPPENITGNYGTMFLNKSYDCELVRDLDLQLSGEYKCGVLFLGRNNETSKAIFSHFTVDSTDLRPKNQDISQNITL